MIPYLIIIAYLSFKNWPLAMALEDHQESTHKRFCSSHLECHVAQVRYVSTFHEISKNFNNFRSSEQNLMIFRDFATIQKKINRKKTPAVKSKATEQ